MIMIIIIIIIIIVVVVVIIINIMIIITIIIIIIIIINIIIIVIILLKGFVYIMADCIYRYCKLVMNQNVINIMMKKMMKTKYTGENMFVIKIKTDTMHRNW